MKNLLGWRNYVKEIAPYIPGKSIEEVKAEFQLDEVIRLASNESPMGTSPRVIEAITRAAMECHLYPDASATHLREELAALYGLRREEVMTGNGADNLISILISAYVNEKDEVLYCTPTFPAYRSATLLMGGVPVEVPMSEDFTFDLESLKEHISERTKLIFICNPNNPTGTIVDAAALEAFVREVPEHTMVVLDEAYIEYVQNENYLTGIDFYKKGYPVVTIRTFSKFYGLAGLRVGYAIAAEEILDPMLRIREPFATNRIAIEAAIAALRDEDYTKEHLAINDEGKKYLEQELTELGYTVYTSYTNFLFVDLKEDVKTLFDALLTKGIIIRPCGAWGYPNFARISIGTMEQNQRLIDALKEWKDQ